MAVPKENKYTILTITGIAFLLLWIFIVNPLTRPALGFYIFGLLISAFIYSSQFFRGVLINLSKNNLGRSLLFGVGSAIVFYLGTQLIPGFAIATPVLPNAIGDTLKAFVVILVAPSCEELIFRGSLLGFIREFNPSPKRIFLANIIQAVAFSLFHIGAYISGWYQLPSFAVGLSALGANIATFFSAFVFALIAGFIVTRNKIKNLAFSIVFHMLVNTIIFTSLAISFG